MNWFITKIKTSNVINAQLNTVQVQISDVIKSQNTRPTVKTNQRTTRKQAVLLANTSVNYVAKSWQVATAGPATSSGTLVNDLFNVNFVMRNSSKAQT